LQLRRNRVERPLSPSSYSSLRKNSSRLVRRRADYFFTAAAAPASLTHLFTKLIIAAPASFFSLAWASHPLVTSNFAWSASHFFMKLFLAAPESFFTSTCDSQTAL